jgi:hypothetical protein
LDSVCPAGKIIQLNRICAVEIYIPIHAAGEVGIRTGVETRHRNRAVSFFHFSRRGQFIKDFLAGRFADFSQAPASPLSKFRS